MEQHFSIADLLAGMGDLTEGAEITEVIAKCPACGMTWDDFRKIGRLGCGECYKAFKQNLLPLLKRIHGSTRHTGKGPAGKAYTATKKSELQELRQKLQRAIGAEEFEEAARIRDKIRESEKKAGAKE
jgi:protein arginine kinase activator